MKIKISLSSGSDKELEALRWTAGCNCRCASFVACDMSNPRPGCARAERLKARAKLEELGFPYED